MDQLGDPFKFLHAGALYLGCDFVPSGDRWCASLLVRWSPVLVPFSLALAIYASRSLTPSIIVRWHPLMVNKKGAGVAE